MQEEFERIYKTVWHAFADYEIDKARPYVIVPDGMPVPSREDCASMAQFLPKLEDCRFLELREEGDQAAYYMESDLANEATTEVTVLRYVRLDDAWKLAPGPHTFNSCNTEQKRDEEGLKTFVEEQESLAPFPEISEAELRP